LIKIIQGNILDAPEDILVQQCNCQGVMGAGLAKQIRDKYPKVYIGYKKLTDQYRKVPSHLLGSTLFINVDDKVIANIFGQLTYGRNDIYTDYKALKAGLLSIYNSVTSEYNIDKNKTIAIPYGIGCGLAGGDWNIVYPMIEEVFKDYDVSIYKLA
jgi:O-acetyl-ADP-ribose deacetylase (regulator of RNase III)